MKKYILKRVLMAMVTILVILFILFLLLEFMPGSPFNDEKLTPELRAALFAKYGLDKPFYIRFLKYLQAVVFHFDFGISYTLQKEIPVIELLSDRVPVTLMVGFNALILGSIIGLVLGVIAAIKRNTILDTLTTVISVIGVSVPSYVLAITLIYFLSYKLGLFPIIYDIDQPIYSLILPTIALSLFIVATVARFMRTEMIEVLNSEFIKLADVKGMNAFEIIFKHGIRNAIIPVITVLGPITVGLLVGSLVIEKIFGIPGIGSLLVLAIEANDYNIIIAIAFIYSLLYILITLIVDILYGVIDPRIRLSKGDLDG